MKRIITAILLVFIVTHSMNCASRGRPGGGPPDKTPPEIIYTFPAKDSVGVKSLDRIEIHFSERMNEGEVQNALFFSPPLEYEAEWSGGEELVLWLKDSIRTERTYVVTIGASARDEHNVKMKDAYQFAFSSGAQLDRGRISGRVYGVKTTDTYMVMGYRMTTEADSLFPMYRDADFLSQSGFEGNFSLSYLPPAEYRVFVVEDGNRNYRLDSDYEKVGIPSHTVVLKDSAEAYEGLNFQVIKIDTLTPKLNGARAQDNRTLLLRFSEPVVSPDITKMSSADTLGNQQLTLLDIAPHEEELNQFYLYTSIQDSGFGYELTAWGLQDTVANRQPDTSYVKFTAGTKKDTTHFLLKNYVPRDSSKNVALEPQITFSFTLPVKRSQFEQGIKLTEPTGKQIAGQWLWQGLTAAQFLVEQPLKTESEYWLIITPGNIVSLWEDTPEETVPDTIRFFTSDDDIYGQLAGRYAGKITENIPVFVRIQPLQRSQKMQQQAVKPDGSFYIPFLPDGKYRIGGFVDLNGDSKYSPGGLYPLQFSEPFLIGTDTLRVRKRWEVNGVEFNIPEWKQ